MSIRQGLVLNTQKRANWSIWRERLQANRILCAAAQNNSAYQRILKFRGTQDGICFLRSDSYFLYQEIIMLKRIFALLLTTLFLAGPTVILTACNTMEGAGKDIQKGGEEIKEEAREHKNY
jgi:predicted small secreted protein